MAFSRGIAELAQGKLLSPIIRAELMKPSFPGFGVYVHGWTERPFDGWWHPSTHSTLTARQLMLYMTQNHLEIKEEPTLEKVIAVTQGHFIHNFLGTVLKNNGVVPELELSKEDPQHRRKGSMDGKDVNGEGVEFKSINEKFLMQKIFDMESLRKHKPGYFGQCQDYLDMHDLDTMRFLFMGVWYPYPMAEFTVERDDVYIADQRKKYRIALEMAEEKEMPEVCDGCTVKSVMARNCPMALACPIGQATMKARR
jgi:hypothetical protein